LRFLDDFFIYIPRHFIFILVQMTNGYWIKLFTILCQTFPSR
jgi:hypothetical protein